MTLIETANGWTRALCFRDRRPPHAVQFALERALMSLFTPLIDDGQLCMHAAATVGGTRFEFSLRFEAALPEENAYSLRVVASWEGRSAEHLDYHRRSSVSWFELWTRALTPANPPQAGTGSLQRYRELTDEALQAESTLNSVADIQHVIVAAMKCGGTYGDSHKEGDTTIFWRDGRFIRSDSGEYPDHRTWTDDVEFLQSLRQFCHLKITRSYWSQTLSELDAWKLILRLLRRA